MNQTHLDVTRETIDEIANRTKLQKGEKVLLSAVLVGRAEALLESYWQHFQNPCIYLVEVRMLMPAPRTINMKEWIDVHVENCATMTVAKEWAEKATGAKLDWQEADAGRAAWAKVNDKVQMVITPFPVRHNTDNVDAAAWPR